MTTAAQRQAQRQGQGQAQRQVWTRRRWRDVAIAAVAIAGIVVLAGAEGATVAWKQARETEIARTAPPELKRVPVNDQGIDFQHPTGGLYPLVELSTGRQIVDGGEPVFMDAGGMRAYPIPTPLPPR